MKVIYVAGKYRGPTPWAVEQNIRAAEEVAARVWALGMVALCPHANARHMLPGLISDEAACEGNLELLRRCDAVVLVPNWRDSEGARLEVAEAERRGIPIFGRYPGTAAPDTVVDAAIYDLRSWLKGQTARGEA